MIDRHVYTVKEICSHIKTILACDTMLSGVAVIGEISNYYVKQPHAYFNLKEPGAVLPCCCFNFRKTYQPKEGEKVICVGSPDFYTAGGRLSLIVDYIEPQGVGLLHQKIEELRKRLTAEGLFEQSHKKPIPEFPRNVVVVTSRSGAVIRDICRTVRARNDIIDIVVKDVKVQGEYAVKEITSALKAVDRLGYDCCILARGGGSLEDLMPFYDEAVVRAVYEMKTPIISAIGHETDFALCDYAADVRCATPTAAGEFIAYSQRELSDKILLDVSRALRTIGARLTDAQQKTRLLAQSVGNGMDRLYRGDSARLRLADSRMIAAVERLQASWEHRLDRAVRSLDNLNPARILKSGYFRVYAGEKPVTSVSAVKVGDNITVRGADGRISAEVREIEKEES